MKHPNTTSRHGCALAFGFGEIWTFIDDAIGDRSWMLGERFSALDVHLFMLSTWLSPDLGHPRIETFANAARVAAKAAERDSIRTAYANHPIFS